VRKALLLGVFAALLIAPGSALAHPRGPFWVVGQGPGLEYYGVEPGEHVTLEGQYGEVNNVPTKVTIRIPDHSGTLGQADVGADGHWTLPVEVPQDLQRGVDYKVVQEPNADTGASELESIVFGVGKPVLEQPQKPTGPPSGSPGGHAPPTQQQAPAHQGAGTPGAPSGSRPDPASRVIQAPVAAHPKRVGRRGHAGSPTSRRHAGDHSGPSGSGAFGSAHQEVGVKPGDAASTTSSDSAAARGRPGAHTLLGSGPDQSGTDKAAAPARQTEHSGTQGGFLLAMGALLLMGAASAAGIVLLRRWPETTDHAKLVTPETPPRAPDAVEAELQEIIAEEHARQSDPVAGR
jgi:hypothetical protein